jgi:AraC-like DNA-binding protein
VDVVLQQPERGRPRLPFDGPVNATSLPRFFELLPFPVNLFHGDGTSAFVNTAFVTMLNTAGGNGGSLLLPEKIVGRYNILNDSTMIEGGRLGGWLTAFAGRTVQFPEVAQPIKKIRSNHRLYTVDLVGFYQDITAFPVLEDSNGDVAFVAAVMQTRQVVRGRPEVSRAIEYLRGHWLEPFDAEAAAAAAGFSKRHFAREFKKHMGLTPHEYLLEYRLERLKDKLRDPGLSISQAFAACGMDYSGWHARLFKENVGKTPSEFRRQGLG